MGGHSSKQTLSASSKVVTNATMNQTQDCIQVADGANILDVFGSGNVVTNVTQNMTFKVDAKCLNTITANINFQTELQNSVTQALKSQDVALTSWLSAGGDNQSTAINNSVATNITSNVVQHCMTNISGQNVINIRGSGNVVDKIAQNQSQSAVMTCMQSGKESMQTITDISNVVNQALSHVSKNPFAFITDAIQAAVRDVAVIIGVVVVAVIAMVVLGKALAHRKKSELRRPPSRPEPQL